MDPALVCWGAIVVASVRVSPRLLSETTPATIDYHREVHAILASRCLGCHSAEKRSGGLSLATYEEVLAGGRSGAVVKSGNSSASLIVRRGNGTRMPLAGPPLTPRGHCPIHHGEGTEAFHANLVRNVFHCFACGAGGTVLEFVAAMENCSIREAALRLQASHGGLAVAASSAPAERQRVTKKGAINPPLSFSLDLDRRHLYLLQRGIDAAIAGHFAWAIAVAGD